MIPWLIHALLSAATLAQPAAPDLSRTGLYTTVAHGCHALDLAGWKHPARQVLTAAGVGIGKVELCNGGTFPVFTVALPFDPDGQADAFYNTLFANLAYANGFWSYALVDTAFDMVVVAAVDRRTHRVTLGYEHFSEAPGVTP